MFSTKISSVKSVLPSLCCITDTGKERKTVSIRTKLRTGDLYTWVVLHSSRHKDPRQYIQAPEGCRIGKCICECSLKYLSQQGCSLDEDVGFRISYWNGCYLYCPGCAGPQRHTALKTQGSTELIPLTDNDRVTHNSSSALVLLLYQVQPSLTKVNKCSSSQGYLRGRYSLPREGLGNEFEVLSLILSMMTVI